MAVQVSSMALVAQSLTSFELIRKRRQEELKMIVSATIEKTVVLPSTDTSRWATVTEFDMSLSSERICIQPSMHGLKGDRW